MRKWLTIFIGIWTKLHLLIFGLNTVCSWAKCGWFISSELLKSNLCVCLICACYYFHLIKTCQNQNVTAGAVCRQTRLLSTYRGYSPDRQSLSHTHANTLYLGLSVSADLNSVLERESGLHTLHWSGISWLFPVENLFNITWQVCVSLRDVINNRDSAAACMCVRACAFICVCVYGRVCILCTSKSLICVDMQDLGVKTMQKSSVWET